MIPAVEWPADWGAPVSAATIEGNYGHLPGAVDVYDGGRNVTFTGALLGSAGTPEAALYHLRRAARDRVQVEVWYAGRRTTVAAVTAIIRPHRAAM